MNQERDSGDSMLKCLDLPSIVQYCGIPSDGIDQPLNLLGSSIQSRMASKLVSLHSSLVAHHPHSIWYNDTI